ncbi:MAG: hypothetical protein E7265_03170 [Lachnospiraceae bacterium]|nr:hypothetical protein [Lachnospiraceae bacterium]
MARIRKKTRQYLSEEDREVLWNLVQAQQIPVLTLDNRWNSLFEQERKLPHIKALVTKLNNLLKEQGGLVNKIKDMKKLKKKLMANIMDNMEGASSDDSRLRDKKQEANHRLIGDINNKLGDSEDRLMELPYEIMKVNKELLFESMVAGYERFGADIKRSKEIEIWIAQIKEELKTRIKEKNEIDKNVSKIYSFMHDMVGREALEMFDSKLGGDGNETSG